MRSFKVGNLKISNDRCIIIAEVGVNHNCSLKIAKKLIFEAKKNGADIVKFQTYKAEKLSIKESPKFRLPNGKMIKKDLFLILIKKSIDLIKIIMNFLKRFV